MSSDVVEKFLGSVGKSTANNYRRGLTLFVEWYKKPIEIIFECEKCGSCCGYSETRNSIAHNRNKRTLESNKAKALAMSCSCKPTTEHARRKR